MSFRAQLLGSTMPPRDLIRFAALVDGALRLHRNAGCLDIDAAIETIYSHADPIDRAAFDAPTARRLAGAALRDGGWCERSPGVWSR